MGLSKVLWIHPKVLRANVLLIRLKCYIYVYILFIFLIEFFELSVLGFSCFPRFVFPGLSGAEEWEGEGGWLGMLRAALLN